MPSRIEVDIMEQAIAMHNRTSAKHNCWVRKTVEYWKTNEMFNKKGSVLNEGKANLWISYVISESHLRKLVDHKELVKKTLGLDGGFDSLVALIKQRTNDWTV